MLCEAIASMKMISLVAFESYSHRRDLAPIHKLKSIKPKLTAVYGVAEYGRFREQLAKLSQDPIRIKEMDTLVIQYSMVFKIRNMQLTFACRSRSG